MSQIDDDLVRALVRKYDTPLYVFQEDVIRKRCSELRRALPYPHTRIRYACKALTIGAVLRILRDEGLWIDASSINEVDRCLDAGFLPNEIVYTGEGASRTLYGKLLQKEVLINCTALDQLSLLGKMRRGARCSIRINPGEGHGETNKTNTGGPRSKHGIYYDELKKIKSIAKTYSLRIEGVHSHIGSGTDLGHWLRIKDKTLQLAREFNNLEFVNLGGGLPVVYNPAADKPMPLQEWGREVADSLRSFSEEYGRIVELHIEPGRYIVAESGSLIATVQSVKRTPEYNFVIVDTGLNHNIRPAIYGSYHPIRFIASRKRRLKGERSYVIAGNLCESGDVFTVDEEGVLTPRAFPILRIGDLMSMGYVGAYCHSMKSEYNSMSLPASVMIHTSGMVRLIERRGTLLDMTRRELEVCEDPQDLLNSDSRQKAGQRLIRSLSKAS
jgi:diaminopimelate decarboxylase